MGLGGFHNFWPPALVDLSQCEEVSGGSGFLALPDLGSLLAYGYTPPLQYRNQTVRRWIACTSHSPRPDHREFGKQVPLPRGYPPFLPCVPPAFWQEWGAVALGADVDDDLSVAAAAAVLPEVDALPGPQRETAIHNGNGK
jgi:hypothetical protein